MKSLPCERVHYRAQRDVNTDSSVRRECGLSTQARRVDGNVILRSGTAIQLDKVPQSEVEAKPAVCTTKTYVCVCMSASLLAIIPRRMHSVPSTRQSRIIYPLGVRDALKSPTVYVVSVHSYHINHLPV